MSLELDPAEGVAVLAETTRYNGIQEHIYVKKHPEVVAWTRYFEKQTSELRIFTDFEDTCPPSEARAKVISALWYRFSAFMPWFLCQAATMVSTNEKRHYVIQTAFEELGMRNAGEIHSELFWNAARSTGQTLADRESVLALTAPAQALDSLASKLLSYESDEEVLGILLGLEIPAIENIEAVFHSLAYRPDLIPLLNRDGFFRLHRQIELEHVRLTVSNYLRFCGSDEQKRHFHRGFTDGIAFWREFWESASGAILIEQRVNTFHV